VYAALSAAYLLLLALAGRMFYKNKFTSSNVNKRIAILVPAYKEDNIILSTARHLLQLDYPPELFRIYIIADSFRAETLEQLKQLPLTVLEVSFVKSTKAKALHDAFNRISAPYDIALICDADNILAKNVLKKIDACFSPAIKAIQARRVAKNLDTSFAILDACSEAINNHLFRKGANGLGLSSSVIGSGMAFDYALIKQVFAEINAVQETVTHEDKILQLRVVQLGSKIRYLDDAYVFDEKVDSPEVFQQQRKRWVLGQFIYLKKYFIPACKELLKGNISYFVLAVVNNLVLPRAFFLALLPPLSVAGFFIDPLWGFAAVGVFVVYMTTLLISIPPDLFNKDLLKAVLMIPKAVNAMFGSLRNAKKANENFITTVKTKTEVSNTLFNEQGK
jgi:cellulose synthase/poly-beta-1,6-N-acetylglucosamine synthase-like glycosyltransferase